MTEPKEMSGHETDDDAPDSGQGKDRAKETPEVMYWRWTGLDRESFLRVKKMLRITSNTDVLRFALGAAERELTRAGGS
jgi:hypothetical protein